MNVWLYWENLPGRSRPAYLDLCLETIRRHSPAEPIVLDYDTAGEHVKLDPARWEALQRPNFRSDYLRARLLHEHGGLWVDFDTIAIMPLQELLDGLSRHDVIAFGAEVGRVYPTVMAAKAGAAPLAAWMSRQDELLNLGFSGYGDMGAGALHGLRDGIGMWPLCQVAPIMWWEWRRFMSYTEPPTYTLDWSTTVVSLWHKGMGPALAEVTSGELLAGQRLLSRLLRIGLGLSTAEDESGGVTRMWPLTRYRFSALGRSVEGRLRGLHGDQPAAFDD